MPLITELHDSLPFIDADITPAEHTRIDKLVASQISLEARQNQTLHPLVPAEPEYHLSPMMRQEVERKAAGVALRSNHGGIDLSRYEAPEAPADTNEVAAWKKTLQRAYASSTYLSGRTSNLSLLEEHGKNAWLIGNAQLEEILRRYEAELETLKATIENVNKARKAAQLSVQGELAVLEDTWKKTIGQILEVEVAAEEMRQEILLRRREKAV